MNFCKIDVSSQLCSQQHELPRRCFTPEAGAQEVAELAQKSHLSISQLFFRMINLCIYTGCWPRATAPVEATGSGVKWRAVLTNIRKAWALAQSPICAPLHKGCVLTYYHKTLSTGSMVSQASCRAVMISDPHASKPYLWYFHLWFLLWLIWACEVYPTCLPHLDKSEQNTEGTLCFFLSGQLFHVTVVSTLPCSQSFPPVLFAFLQADGAWEGMHQVEGSFVFQILAGIGFHRDLGIGCYIILTKNAVSSSAHSQGTMPEAKGVNDKATF